MPDPSTMTPELRLYGKCLAILPFLLGEIDTDANYQILRLVDIANDILLGKYDGKFLDDVTITMLNIEHPHGDLNHWRLRVGIAADGKEYDLMYPMSVDLDEVPTATPAKLQYSESWLLYPTTLDLSKDPQHADMYPNATWPSLFAGREDLADKAKEIAIELGQRMGITEQKAS